MFPTKNIQKLYINLLLCFKYNQNLSEKIESLRKTKKIFLKQTNKKYI